jgi:hypothetical protein
MCINAALETNRNATRISFALNLRAAVARFVHCGMRIRGTRHAQQRVLILNAALA